MHVTVAVVSWNTRDLLARCLSSLEPAAHAGFAEVWVVDNASSDGSAAMVAARFPWVRLITSDHNLGFGAAINAVAEAGAAEGTRTEWIAAANADISLRPGALEAMLSAGRKDPEIGIVAPALILADGSTEHSLHPFPGLKTSLVLNLGVAHLSRRLAQRLALDGHWDQSTARRGDWAHGAFLLIRRRAFDQVGRFSSDQFLHAEDLDIAWRLSRAGWQTQYEPAARVDHVRGAAIQQFYGDQGDLHAQMSAYAWMLRRRGAAVMRACALANTVGAGARALTAQWLGSRESAGDAVGLEPWQLRRHTGMHLHGLITSRRRLKQHH